MPEAPDAEDHEPERGGNTGLGFPCDPFEVKKPLCIAEELLDLETVIVAGDDLVSGGSRIIRDQEPRLRHAALPVDDDAQTKFVQFSDLLRDTRNRGVQETPLLEYDIHEEQGVPRFSRQKSDEKWSRRTGNALFYYGSLLFYRIQKCGHFRVVGY